MDKELNEENRRTKERSTAYPAISLEDAVSAATELADKLGAGSFDRETAAQALGYKGVSGTSATKIATLTHFGLLDRQGNTYSQSALARRIVAPKSEADKSSAIVEALRTPKLYSKLLEKYSGQALPTMLNNILFHDFGIILSSSKEASEVFKRSLEYAGALKNGIVIVDDGGDKGQATENMKEVTKDENTPGDSIFKQPQNYFSVRLPSGVMVSCPQDLSYDFGLGVFAKPLQELEAITKKLRASDGMQE